MEYIKTWKPKAETMTTRRTQCVLFGCWTTAPERRQKSGKRIYLMKSAAAAAKTSAAAVARRTDFLIILWRQEKNICTYNNSVWINIEKINIIKTYNFGMILFPSCVGHAGGPSIGQWRPGDRAENRHHGKWLHFWRSSLKTDPTMSSGSTVPTRRDDEKIVFNWKISAHVYAVSFEYECARRVLSIAVESESELITIYSEWRCGAKLPEVLLFFWELIFFRFSRLTCSAGEWRLALLQHAQAFHNDFYGNAHYTITRIGLCICSAN